MKKMLLSGIFWLIVISGANAQNVNIPDPVFKNFLINHSYSNNPTGAGVTIYLDANHDGEIQYSEAASYTSNIYNRGFFLNGAGISDLTGIEAFQSIEYLNIDDNQLSSLDIGGCSSLKTLRSNGNFFTQLNLVNASLETLDINNCPTLTDLNLNGLPQLKKATVQQNAALAVAELNSCGLLEELRINFNPLLTSLQMGTHFELTSFFCIDNNLTALDVSSCEALQYLFCTGNQLTALNLANGNPQSFIQIRATGHPDLTCIKVDNVTVSEFLWDGDYPYEFDQWTSFATDCTPPGPCVVTIPDAVFKAYLIANAAINTNANDEIECSEAEAYSGSIDLDSLPVADLTGIKSFTNLTALSCSNASWEFTTLDVSGMSSLASVSSTGNVMLETLDASGCTALTAIDVNFANALSLNLQGCIALTNLDLANRNLVSLNLTGCSALTSLDCSGNSLTQLGLLGCNALTSIDCSDNEITSLAVNSIGSVVTLDCSNNQLSALTVIGNAMLKVLDCSDNQLPYLIVSTNAALQQLDCSNNDLTYLDVNNNAALLNLDCSHNNLNALLLVSNTALLSVNCSHNSLSALNLISNVALTTLNCDANNIPLIDVAHNVNLTSFTCASNQLQQLELGNNAALVSLDCSSNQLTSLDLSAQQLLLYLHCHSNQLTALDLSATRCRMLNCDSNQLESLNVANGYNMFAVSFSGIDNPALECVQVDDAEYSTEHWAGLGAFDDVVTFSEDCADLGVEAIANIAFKIYPNPTKNEVYFTKQMNVALYNVTGQRLDGQSNTSYLDLSAQPGGIYFLVFHNDSGEVLHRKKVVKR